MHYKNYDDLDQAFREHWFGNILERKKTLTSIGIDVSRVSSNTVVNEKIILNNPNFPWEDAQLIFNDSLGWEFYKKRITDALNEGVLSYNPKNLLRWRNNKCWTNNREDYGWVYLSEHPKINIVDIVEMRSKPWDIGNLLGNQSLNWNDINRYFIEGDLVPTSNKYLILQAVSSNYNISINFILQNVTWNWRWTDVIVREDITQDQFMTIYEMIKPDVFTSGDEEETIGQTLSSCKMVDWNFVKTHPDIKWNWAMLSMHPKIELKTIIDNSQCKWNWEKVSDNPNLQWQDIISNIDKSWNWSSISMHQNINWEIIKNNRNRPWSWTYVSMNRNIGWDTIIQNKHVPWDYEKLIVNTMTRYKGDWIEKTRLMWIYARKIQNIWRRVTSDPTYILCKKKLVLVYNEQLN